MSNTVFGANKIARWRWVRFAPVASAMVALCTALSLVALAQPQAQPPDLTRVWAVYRGARGGDPKLAPTEAGPLALKPEYAKPYQARRAAEAEANQRGEQLAN